MAEFRKGPGRGLRDLVIGGAARLGLSSLRLENETRGLAGHTLPRRDGWRERNRALPGPAEASPPRRTRSEASGSGGPSVNNWAWSRRGQ